MDNTPKAGARPGNKNAAKADAERLDGQVLVRMPKATISAMRQATRKTGDRGLSAFCRRLIEQELCRLGLLEK